jgi:ligand-binding sensor domain-containing protein
MPSKPFIPIVYILLCFVLQNSYASTVLYDDSRGLSNNHVTGIVKDNSGLLWIATLNGLNTFDGYTIKEIAHFKNIKINTLCYDSLQDVLWVGSNAGLFRINNRNSTITDCTVKLKKKDVNQIILYKNSIFILFSHGTIIKLTDTKATPIFGINQLGGKYSYMGKLITSTASGMLYFSITNFKSLLQINLNTGQTSILNHLAINNISSLALFNGNCFALMKSGTTVPLSNNDSINNTTILTQHNLSQLDIIHGFNNEYYASFKDQYGIFRFNLLNKKWQLLNTGENTLFKSKIITSILRDAHRVLWIATNKGLIKIDLEEDNPFKILFDGHSPPISNREILQINERELYVATYAGIYHYDLHHNKAVLIDSARNDTVFPLYTRALCYDQDYLYAGTESHSNYFYRVNLKTNTSEGYFFKTIPDNIHISYVYSIIKGTNNLLWLATDKGIVSYNIITNTITLHNNDKFDVSGTRLFYLSRANQTGCFWAAGRGAFYLIDEQRGIIKSFNEETLNTQFIDDDFIFINEHENGKVWIGTKKSGLIVFDVDHLKTKVISRSDGLSSNEVYGILWQNDSIGWVSTVNGLCRYNRSTNTFNNYFYEDGLSDNEFNQNSLLKANNNVMYFGGINGLNCFNPQLIHEIKDDLSIFSASVSKWNRNSQTFITHHKNESVIMNPNDHLLTFTFGLSDYSQTEAHTYFYRIPGLYEKWVSLGNQNFLRLEGLPAGSYQVDIIGFNKKGTRSKNILSYYITIEQVFYKTWWFYVIIVACIALLIYGYFKWRLRNISQKLKLRTQIASNLHDEVGSLLTSIIISTDSARYNSSTIEEKNKKLEKISSLSRDATNTMSDVLWSIDARNDYAGNLTDRMREQAESMLFPKNIEVEFDFKNTQQHQNIDPEIRQQLYLIFKEAINNIVKHSDATMVKVSYKQTGPSFEMSIENNNHFKTTNIGTYSGQGIKNMQMRAKKIGTTSIFSEQDQTFKVTIRSK